MSCAALLGWLLSVGMILLILAGLAQSDAVYLCAITALGLLSIVAFHVNLWRLRWMVATPSGFQLIEQGRCVEYRIDQVVGITRRILYDPIHELRIRVWLEIPNYGLNRTIPCTYRPIFGGLDPLADLWRRIITSIGHSETLDGNRWQLNRVGFHYRGVTVPIEQLTRVLLIGQRVCLWRGEEELPFATLPANSRNALPLIAMLRYVTVSKPLADNPLGRVLLDRRSKDWVVGLAISIFGAVISALLLYESIAYRWSLDNTILFQSPWVAATVIGVHLVYRGFTSRVIFHEHGVVQPGRRGRRTVASDEIETVTWLAGPQLLLIPRPMVGKLPITYFAWLLSTDNALEAMRDRICLHLAKQWQGLLTRGPVRWTSRLRFVPGGLECTPAGLFGIGGTTTVPYLQTSYVIENGIFKLFVIGTVGPVYSQPTMVPNFYVGLMLLNLIYGEGNPTS